MLVTYEWSKQKDNVTLACDDCQENNEDVISRGTKYNGVEPDTPDCACSVCKCDMELVKCLRASGNCVPPLFGILD